MLAVRPKIRTLMVLVAGFALLLGVVTWGLRLRRLSREYRAQAQLHAARRFYLDAMTRSREGLLEMNRQSQGREKGDWDPDERRELEALAKQVEHQSYMVQKYEYAASHPWEAVPSGPREPVAGASSASTSERAGLRAAKGTAATCPAR